MALASKRRLDFFARFRMGSFGRPSFSTSALSRGEDNGVQRSAVSLNSYPGAPNRLCSSRLRRPGYRRLNPKTPGSFGAPLRCLRASHMSRFLLMLRLHLYDLGSHGPPGCHSRAKASHGLAVRPGGTMKVFTNVTTSSSVGAGLMRRECATGLSGPGLHRPGASGGGGSAGRLLGGG